MIKEPVDIQLMLRYSAPRLSLVPYSSPAQVHDEQRPRPRRVGGLDPRGRDVQLLPDVLRRRQGDAQAEVVQLAGAARLLVGRLVSLSSIY